MANTVGAKLAFSSDTNGIKPHTRQTPFYTFLVSSKGCKARTMFV